MATGIRPRLASLIGAALLASCQQGAPAPAGDAVAAGPGDAATLALLQARYGQPARLQGEWTQQLDDPGGENARPVHRHVCADRSIDAHGARHRMLAICTAFGDAAPVEPGSSDFIVLRGNGDGRLDVAAELLGHASGSGGRTGDVATAQAGADAWAFLIDDELMVMGSVMRDRSLLLFDGGSTLVEAGWLRTHLDDRNAEECDPAGRCTGGRLDLDFAARFDDSQPQLAHWPLDVQETGNGCEGPVQRQHRIAYDPARSRYRIPSTLQLEGCN